jgi:methylmalonyl-CoA epimerase
MKFYEQMFGVTPSDVEVISDQGVKAVLLRVGGSQIELIQPLESDNAVGRFIESRGESVHHICFEVDNLQEKLEKMSGSDIRLIDETPREGLSGMIAFIHPKSTNGVLYELVDSGTARR